MSACGMTLTRLEQRAHEQARTALAVWGKVLEGAKRMGVKIAYGTDAGVFSMAAMARRLR